MTARTLAKSRPIFDSSRRSQNPMEEANMTTIQFPSPPQTQPSLKDIFGGDAGVLKLVAEWRAYRAQQQQNWALHELATGWGHLPDKGIDLDRSPLDRMQEIEGIIVSAVERPRTMLLARELLKMAETIFADREADPDSTLGCGPALQVMRIVLEGLYGFDGATPLPHPRLKTDAGA